MSFLSASVVSGICGSRRLTESTEMIEGASLWRGSTAVLVGAGEASKARRSEAETIMAPTEEALTARTLMRASVRSGRFTLTDGTFAGGLGGLPRKRAERLRGIDRAADVADGGNADGWHIGSIPLSL